MERTLKIAGVNIKVQLLTVGEVKVFPGAGAIIAAALKRTSKNKYKIYMIYAFDAECYMCSSFGKAIDDIQEEYKRFGQLDSVGISPARGKKE